MLTRQGFALELTNLCTLRQTKLTSFAESVAYSVFDTFCAALEDKKFGIKRLQVSSAPTGSGKTSSAIAFLAYAWRAARVRSALVVETVRQADDLYRELRDLLGPDVGVWTHDHDIGRSPKEVLSRRGFEPAAQFHRSDLEDKAVVVVTHAFLEGVNGHLASADRDIIVYDEKPQEVSVFDLGIEDLVAFRDHALQAFGDGSNIHQAAVALRQFADQIYEAEQERDYRGSFMPVPTAELNESLGVLASIRRGSEEATALIAAGLASDDLSRIVGFATALEHGYAFVSRYGPSARRGCRFVGYSMDFPLRPGMALLDATSDIDGVSRLVPWRAASLPCPQVNYSRLAIHATQPPEMLTGILTTTLLSRVDLVHGWREWVIDLVARNTAVGDKVLIVCSKKLVPHLPMLSGLHSGTTERDEWMGRQIHYCHWGDGIGANRWRECRHVFLIGEFHVPRRATVAGRLGLGEVRPSIWNLKDAQNIQGFKGDFLTLQEGHLLRWMKQLACRGNVRNVDQDGMCGEMKLWVTGDFDRIALQHQRLFPGSRLVRDVSANPAIQKSSHEPFISRLVTLLLITHADALTTGEVEHLLSSRLHRHVSKLKSAATQVTLSDIGWEFHAGQRGRGKPARFIRTKKYELRGVVKAA